MFFGGDPFEHFAGMHGGMPGGRGGGGPRADVDTTKLYETLGVSFYEMMKEMSFLLFFFFICLI